MTKDEWLSPVRILNTELLGTRLEIIRNSDVASPTLSVSVSLRTEHLEKTEGVYAAKCIFEFGGVWHDPEDADIVAYRIECAMGITIAIPDSAFEEGFPVDKIWRFVDANAVSLVYGKIRSFIEDMTAQSSIGKQTIPAIEPIALLSALAEDPEKPSSDK